MNIHNNGATALTAGDIERIQQRIAELEKLEQKNTELAAQVEQLKELASFWIDQAEPKRGSKQDYNTWLALGYESACMRLSTEQLARIKQQGGEA